MLVTFIMVAMILWKTFAEPKPVKNPRKTSSPAAATSLVVTTGPLKPDSTVKPPVSPTKGLCPSLARTVLLPLSPSRAASASSKLIRPPSSPHKVYYPCSPSATPPPKLRPRFATPTCCYHHSPTPRPQFLTRCASH
uniref:Secreted protein n=1 Tax=Strigamia maritima TaxID=126957 RepID=T1JE80_STRMM